MKTHKMVFSFKNISIYLLGAVIISFAVVMMLRSMMGVSSWDTLHYSLHALTGITIGKATIVVAIIFTVFVTVANKDAKYIGMVIPILLVGALIDLFNLHLLVNYLPINIYLRIITYFIGLVLLPFGGSLLIISSFPAGVFDEFMITLMRLLKTNNLVLVRVIMEITAVAVAIMLGFIAGIQFGMVNIGTLIFSLSVGVFIKTYLKLFERVGLYEIEQIN
ncbi:MAG: hypothetical protein KAJ22_04745 [Candidatus Izimaplasma sp.]|nr:hypothetical protein [Candidatus Izimaplasma bacterium]